MDRPRGKPVGGRARGKAQEASQGGPSQQQQRGPSPQQAFQNQHGPSPAAPPSQQSGWGPRGRGSAGGAPPQQQRGSARGSAAGGPPQQQRGPEQMVQQMQKLTVSAVGDPSASTSGAAPARGGIEPTRGNTRQKNVDDTYMFRSKTLSSKQGSRGDQVMLQANYFKYLTRTDVHLYQYRVDFEPDIDVTIVRKAILRNHKEQFGKAYVFDGTVLYTQQRLKDGLELTSKNNKDDSFVRILIKLTTDLQMGDPHYVSFLNQILRGCLAKMDLQLVRRDYYDAKAKIELHQHKLEIWPGYKTSVRQHENDLLMVCDLSSKVMRHESAFAFLMSCRQRSPHDYQRIFAEAMIGSVVITGYNNRTYMIDDIDWKLNPSSTFDMKGRTVSFREYFKEKYQLNITSDEQPMLISMPKEKDKRGGRGDQNICLVPELSFLTGVDDNMRADFNLMKAIAEYTRLPPNKQIERLEQGFMKRLNTTKPCQESLALWNMAFEPRLISFPGRILPPENIIVGDQATLPTDPILGQFTRPLTSSRCRLLDPAQMNSWAIVYPQKMNHRDIVNFCQTLAKSCHTLGFHIPEPHFEKIADDRNGTYVSAIEVLVSSGQFTLLMTVVPNVRADRYEAIKKKCYVQRITPNQVVLAKNITNKNLMSVATKIGIQMCCKVGGSPWTTNIPFKGPTMIVGFDVCHDTYMKKSVGALVASLNAQHTRYFSSVSFHDSGEEICKFMAIEMQKALAKYMEINSVIPERIFFYRDGVGEGNLHYVLENEVKGICDQWKASYSSECPLTFIVVSKGIKTKIYQNRSNPPPGTVVDSVITLPTMYDFYLVSQSVRQGTVNPTSYNVIYDQQNLRPDIVQQLSYKLTHMYFNWSGTIRVPAPCQYAHKLAGLVGQHIHTSPTGMDDLLYFL